VALEGLEAMFKEYPCITDIRLIKTASIPVMKLTMDTSIPFVFAGYEIFPLNREHNWGPIQADITIEAPSHNNQSSHLGLRTTNAISQWLTTLQPLHKLVIIMKEFFTLNKLNLAYEGGLNTISMIVMFVAFITHAKLEDE
jgi:DNA polymerase sigma